MYMYMYVTVRIHVHASALYVTYMHVLMYVHTYVHTCTYITSIFFRRVAVLLATVLTALRNSDLVVGELVRMAACLLASHSALLC